MSQAHDGVALDAHVDTSAGCPNPVGVAELNDRAVRSQLSDYLEGALTTSELERVSHHLDNCTNCTAYLRTLRRTVTLLGELPSVSAPDSAKDAIVQRARAEP